MRNDSSRLLFMSKNFVTLFMTAVLCGESLHYHEHHNPHGNRRERIEEIRTRMAEAQRSLAGSFERASGGSPPPQPERLINTGSMGRRRMHGLQGMQ